MKDTDDVHFIRQIRDGNTDAFVHIVRRYERMVFSVVVRIMDNKQDAEDVTQEIFVKVFQSLDKFREESEFSTWLYRIAYNTTMSELRKRKYEFHSIDDAMDNIPDDDAQHGDEARTEQLLQCMDEVLARMSADDAMIVSMFYLNRCSVQDICDITGHSPGNTKVKLHRIRKYMNIEINKLMQS